MEPALPLKSVVMFIAFGGMVAIMVFLFAKRQITRFALKSSRHVPISTGVPKYLRQEIERTLKRTTEIKYEPVLLSPGTHQTITDKFQTGTCHFIYRMKTVDAIKRLDVEFSRYSSRIKRHPGDNLRLFLLDQRQNGPLEGIKMDIIEKLVDGYEHARHDPADFKEENYETFMQLLNILLECIKNKRNEENSGQPSSVGSVPSDSTTGGNDKDSGIQVTYRPGNNLNISVGGAAVTEVVHFTPESSVESKEDNTAV